MPPSPAAAAATDAAASLSDKAELTRFQVLSGIVRLAEESVAQAKLNKLSETKIRTVR